MATQHNIKFALLTVLFLISLGQSFDPLDDYCRHFAHQTTVIDRQLFIDGGLMNFGGETVGSNGQNYTSE